MTLTAVRPPIHHIQVIAERTSVWRFCLSTAASPGCAATGSVTSAGFTVLPRSVWRHLRSV